MLLCSERTAKEANGLDISCNKETSGVIMCILKCPIYMQYQWSLYSDQRLTMLSWATNLYLVLTFTILCDPDL